MAETSDKKKSMSNIVEEDIFDLVGKNGPWQWYICLASVIFAIPGATYTLTMSFFAPKMDHWCSRPENSNITIEEWKKVAVPSTDMHCKRFIEINQTLDSEMNITTLAEEEFMLCDSWEFDTSFYKSTVVNQWNLVCDREWLISLSKSAYMFGMFASNFLCGQLADSVGRKFAITASAVVTFISSLACAFSTSFSMFIITRFFLALGYTGAYATIFVLLLEMIAPDERSIYGIVMKFGWCIGFVALPGIVYVIRDWFWIQIALTAPCLLLLCSWWVLPESPRWLLSKGRFQEAKDVLILAAKFNGKKIEDDDKKFQRMMKKATEDHESGETKGTFIDLFRSRGLRYMTLNIYFLWFVTAFVYYGLSLNTNEIDGNPFVNFALSGAMEFPAYVYTILAIRYFGRRYPLAGSFILSGLACLLVYPIPTSIRWLTITLQMIGKTAITSSFAIIYVITAELFPTVVRNIGLGSAATISRLGAISAPFVYDLGVASHPVVPQLLLGISGFVAGLLVFLLPETKNKRVPETLAEAAFRSETKSSMRR